MSTITVSFHIRSSDIYRYPLKKEDRELLDTQIEKVLDSARTLALSVLRINKNWGCPLEVTETGNWEEFQKAFDSHGLISSDSSEQEPKNG